MRILRPRRKPKKAYPNSDRFEEDGRRIYSAYAPASHPRRRISAKARLLTGTIVVIGATALMAALAWWAWHQGWSH